MDELNEPSNHAVPDHNIVGCVLPGPRGTTLIQLESVAQPKNAVVNCETAFGCNHIEIE
jgi:hypothetical protein